MLGNMRAFITVANKIITKDNAGFEILEEYQPVLETRATMEQKKANEFWASLATFANVDTIFKFRRAPDVEIGTDMYVLVNKPEGEPDIYNILYIDETKGAGMYYEVYAERIKPSRG